MLVIHAYHDAIFKHCRNPRYQILSFETSATEWIYGQRIHHDALSFLQVDDKKWEYFGKSIQERRPNAKSYTKKLRVTSLWNIRGRPKSISHAETFPATMALYDPQVVQTRRNVLDAL
jgi:hypothetical protein